MTIKLYNSKTREKQVFEPLDPTNVRMYVCGPTVYDRAHLGNARPVLVFDVLYRLLRHVYGDAHVTYVRNFTDVDDKINASALARQQGGDPRPLEALIAERTEETIAWYHADMGELGALRPTHAPRATQYIDQMIEMIETLIRKGFAYSKPISYGHNSRAVYFKSEKAPQHHSFFHVEKDERYGELSGRSLEDMISGAKAEIGEGKMNPMDFVLWKPSTVDEPGWPSPWGYGRPGWHIECSAMADKLLWEDVKDKLSKEAKKHPHTFDIHGGGLDLQFPHHENEIAQSCCANGTDEMARFWMHNEMLQVEGKKMSKSLGNFFTVRDLLDKGYAGEVIRFVMLSTHYRKPMDWTEAKAREARQILFKWASLVNDRPAITNPNPPFEKHDLTLVQAFSDDLNTPAAITQLHRLYDESQNVSNEGNRALSQLYHSLNDFMGIDLEKVYQALRPKTLDDEIQRLEMGVAYDKTKYGEAIQRLVDGRSEAKKNRDWAKADALRLTLAQAGVIVTDGPDGSTWELSPDFDMKTLASAISLDEYL